MAGAPSSGRARRRRGSRRVRPRGQGRGMSQALQKAIDEAARLIRSGKVDDRYTIAEAMRWADETDSQPFFMYVNLQNSHVPYETPADFPRRFGPAELPFAIRFNHFPPDQAEVVKDVRYNFAKLA